MKELRINPNLITHIEITDFENTNAIWIEAIPEKSYLFGLFKDPAVKAGWQDPFWESYIISKNTTEINGALYYNPFLRVYSGKSLIYGKHYKTIEEIEKFCDENFSNVNVKINRAEKK